MTLERIIALKKRVGKCYCLRITVEKAMNGASKQEISPKHTRHYRRRGDESSVDDRHPNDDEGEDVVNAGALAPVMLWRNLTAAVLVKATLSGTNALDQTSACMLTSWQYC